MTDNKINIHIPDNLVMNKKPDNLAMNKNDENANKKTIIDSIYGESKKAKIVDKFIIMIMLRLLESVLQFIGTLTLVWLLNFIMENDRFMISVLIIIKFVIKLLEFLIKFKCYNINKIILISFNENALCSAIKFYCDADFDWLRLRNTQEDFLTIKSGIQAQSNVLYTFGYIIINIFNSIASIFGIVYIVGFNSIPSLLCMMIIFLFGCNTMKKNYQKMESIEKKNNNTMNMINALSSNILTRVFNGEGQLVSKQISKQFNRKLHETWAARINTEYNYLLLEFIHYSCIFLNLIFLVYSLDNLLLLYPIITGLLRACSLMWRVFHNLSRMANDASPFGPFQELLSKIKLEINNVNLIGNNKKRFQFTDIAEIFNAFHKDIIRIEKIKDSINNINPLKKKECQITGKSGQGKTTFMIDLIIWLIRNYGDIIYYMPQNKQVIKSNKMSIWKYLTMNIHQHIIESRKEEIINKILELSNKLNLENIIDKVKLFDKFGKPSGGEDKRIAFMQLALWIYFSDLGDKKIMFIDEITAGLDEESLNMVRLVVQEIKDDFDLFCITIDHHEIDNVSKVLIQNNIIKKVTYEPPNNKNNNKNGNDVNLIIEIYNDLYKLAFGNNDIGKRII